MRQTILKNFINNVQKESKTDMMIMACDQAGAVSLTMVGDMTRVTAALFASLNDKKRPDIQKQLFDMVKNLAFNIIRTPSPMSDELLAMIASLATEDGEEEDKGPATIMQMYPDKKNSK